MYDYRTSSFVTLELKRTRHKKRSGESTRAEAEAESKPSPPLDRALHALGFEFTRITARVGADGGEDGEHRRLHGVGVLAGVQLSINHIEPARLGDLVQAQATTVQLGSKIQLQHLTWVVKDLTAVSCMPPSQQKMEKGVDILVPFT